MMESVKCVAIAVGSPPISHQPTETREADMSHTPNVPSPKGHSTWLDYAVATMDTRAAYLEASGLFDDADPIDPPPSRDDMRAAASAELAVLRRAAATG
jgi:hypothetical protein